MARYPEATGDDQILPGSDGSPVETGVCSVFEGARRSGVTQKEIDALNAQFTAAAIEHRQSLAGVES